MINESWRYIHIHILHAKNGHIISGSREPKGTFDRTSAGKIIYGYDA